MRDSSPDEQNPAPVRRLTCALCGAAFDCTPAGECWCMAEPYRLPMPDTGTRDCLCPACLRAQAGAAPR